MSIAFWGGFTQGLGDGLEKFNKNEEEKRVKRETQQETHNKNQIALNQRYEKSIMDIREKQEKLMSKDSKLSSEARIKSYNSLQRSLEQIKASASKEASTAGYFVSDLVLNQDTAEVFEHDGYLMDASTKKQIDDGDFQIKNGKVLSKIEVSPAMYEDPQEEGIEPVEVTPAMFDLRDTGLQINKVEDVFATAAPKYTGVKMTKVADDGKTTRTITTRSTQEEAFYEKSGFKRGSLAETAKGKESAKTPTGDKVEIIDKNGNVKQVATKQANAMEQANVGAIVKPFENLKDVQENVPFMGWAEEEYGSWFGFDKDDAAKMFYFLQQDKGETLSGFKTNMSRIGDLTGGGVDAEKISTENFNTEDVASYKKALLFKEGKIKEVNIKSSDGTIVKAFMNDSGIERLKKKFGDNVVVVKN